MDPFDILGPLGRPPHSSQRDAQLLIIAIDRWGPDCGDSLTRTMESLRSIQRSPYLVPTVYDDDVGIPHATKKV